MANFIPGVPENNNDAYAYQRLTVSGLIKTGQGLLGGFMVASGTPTVTLYDNTSAAAPIILNATVTVAGTRYPLPVVFNTGLYAVLSGTGDITFYYL